MQYSSMDFSLNNQKPFLVLGESNRNRMNMRDKNISISGQTAERFELLCNN